MYNKKEMVVVVLAAVIGKLKLNQLSKAELAQRAMNALRGGRSSCDETCGNCGAIDCRNEKGEADSNMQASGEEYADNFLGAYETDSSFMDYI